MSVIDCGYPPADKVVFPPELALLIIKKACAMAAAFEEQTCRRQRRIYLRADARLTQLQSAEIQHRKWFARNQTGSVASR